MSTRAAEKALPRQCLAPAASGTSRDTWPPAGSPACPGTPCSGSTGTSQAAGSSYGRAPCGLPGTQASVSRWPLLVPGAQEDSWDSSSTQGLQRLQKTSMAPGSRDGLCESTPWLSPASARSRGSKQLLPLWGLRGPLQTQVPSTSRCLSG